MNLSTVSIPEIVGGFFLMLALIVCLNLIVVLICFIFEIISDTRKHIKKERKPWI